MSLGLSNIELEKLAQQMLGKNFIGVYPCDSTPKNINKKIFSVIFNLSKHDENGTHFVAILKKNNDIFYFDSFGKNCYNEFILKFINSLSNTYYFNNFQIQNQSSIFCGIFCLGFLLACQKLNYKPEEYLNMFYLKKKCNDDIVTRFIVSSLRK